MSLRNSLRASHLFAIALLLLQGCATVSRFEATTPATTVAVRGLAKIEMPSALTLDSKATGQHEFKAVAATGQSLYGLLPLRVNGGRMAGSILLFAPTLFIAGFRDPFGFYQVDLNAGLLNFKMKETDEWRAYRPTVAESERAKAYFDAVEVKCKSEAGQNNVPTECANARAN